MARNDDGLTNTPGMGQFTLDDGSVVQVRDDWARDFNITDLNSLQAAANRGIGGENGINIFVNGREMLYFPDSAAGSQGLRSDGRMSLPGGGFAVDAAGFVNDHNTLEGVLGQGKGIKNAIAGVGPVLGAAYLSGAMGAAGAAEAGAAGAFDMGGLAGTGIEVGAAGPNTVTGFTVGEGMTAAQAAAGGVGAGEVLSGMDLAADAIAGSGNAVGTIGNAAGATAGSTVGGPGSNGWWGDLLTWGQNNQQLASTGLALGGGFLRSAFSPSPGDIARDTYNARAEAERALEDWRRRNNIVTGVNVSRLRPTGTPLRRAGIVESAMRNA